MSTSGRLPRKTARALEEVVRSEGGFLPADVVADLRNSLDLGLNELAVELLPVAGAFATPPVSGFRVGGVAYSDEKKGTGRFYLGANLEVRGQALGFSVHAEQATVVNAWHHDEATITHLAVSAPPCGHCRQYLLELPAEGDLEIVLPSEDGPPRVSRLGTLIPDHFGPRSLNPKHRPLGTRARLPAWSLEGRSKDPLLGMAFEAARHSYVPYTESHAGVAIETVGGLRVSGRYSESVAYNPSLSPLLAAISRMNVALPKSADPRLVRAVLVEARGRISQRTVCEVALAEFAPDIELEYHRVGRP